MQMRRLLPVLLGMTMMPAVSATAGELDIDYQITYERASLEGVTLGDDAAEDRFTERDLEFEFALDYGFTQSLYLFFVGALIYETETVDDLGREDSVSGLERVQMGLGYLFGDTVQSELRIGRSEFESTGERWPWWDEELDALRLDSSYRDFEITLGLAEELAAENTDIDDIEPELEDVRRLLLNLGWEFADGQVLELYYLDQRDNSKSLEIGEFEDVERIDESDADLSWAGVSYRGLFELTPIGEFEVEWHWAQVRGDETLYEFEDPVGGRAEVSDRIEQDVAGSAGGLFVSLVPARFDDWRFTLGRVRGDGDDNPDDGDDDAFRQTGLEGESEVFGEAFQPELSNLVIDIVGIAWEVSDGVELAIYRYDYEQEELSEELRDAAIDLDPNGTSRKLGHEIDLVLTITPRDDIEVILTAAEFHAGSAFADPDPDSDRSGEVASYFKFEIAWEF